MRDISTFLHLLWLTPLIFLAAACLLLAQNEIPINRVDGQHMREWLVLGPFNTADLDKGFLAAVGGEVNVTPRPLDVVRTADGRTLQWKHYRSQVNGLVMTDVLGMVGNATAYAYCVLKSDISSNFNAEIASDDGAALWLNGEQVFRNPRRRSINQAGDWVKIPLKKGENHCLIKLFNGRSGWGIKMRGFPASRTIISGTVTDETGAPVNRAEVRLEQTHARILQTRTDASGHYDFALYPVSGRYDLSAASGEKGAWRIGLTPAAGEDLAVNLTIKPAVAITGALQTLDDSKAHVSIPVQAVQVGTPQHGR